jgi:phage repressor protein C with HTH and peptisase S24 domain
MAKEMKGKVKSNPLFKGEHENTRLISNELTVRADGVATLDGNGLEPMYHDGDTVMIEMCDMLSAGEIGVFDFPDIGIAIRYKGKDALYRINPECEDRVKSDRNARVLARVIGRVTPDMIIRDNRNESPVLSRPESMKSRM